MLVDDDKELPGELEIEEQKATKPELPEKYRDKSLDEIVRMHQEAEKLIGKQAQEVGEVRKLADELIRQNLGSKQQPIRQDEPEIDFFEDPKKAVQKTVDSHPDIIAARQATLELKRTQIQQKLAQEHPDFGDIAKDQDFANWVKSSPVRIELFKRADAEFDYDSANELLSTYKQLRGVKKQQSEASNEATRKQSLKAVGVDVGGSGESSRKVYRRADLIRLKMQDPNRYDALSDEIMQAYAEGRVR
jgi:hypothetical protein